MYKHFFKRIFDLIAALLGLLVLSPIFIIVFIILGISNGGKPFFIQERPGKQGRIFKIIKFKTMNDKKDDQGDLLPDFDRITAFGGFVRKFSLDEIPQLINVLRGDMSVVGPRPLLVSYLPLYNAEQRKRHTVRPGITGLAQVNGRNAISWDQKFKYDVEYTETVSVSVDLKIILKTVKKVFISEGIVANDKVTMEKFKGN
ncbi:sugar transferase [Spongiimicrobium salis]|uniref:sugar transferase n=1 Tax=Spongiimicrobium salis TaxID=1667022 RepID=UPI00374D65A2